MHAFVQISISLLRWSITLKTVSIHEPNSLSTHWADSVGADELTMS